MKFLPTLFVAVCLLMDFAHAAVVTNTVTLTWNPSPPSQGVTGYNIYQSTAGGPFVKVVTTPTTGPVIVLSSATNFAWYFKPVNATGEAVLPSNTISTNFKAPPLPLPTAGTGLRFQ